MWRLFFLLFSQPNGKWFAQKNTNSSHTFIFIIQSSRCWNKFSYEKILKREIALESPTFSDRMYVALIVVGFDWKMILFHISFPSISMLSFVYCHESDKFTIACLVQFKENELLQPRRNFFSAMEFDAMQCAHKLQSFKVKTFVLSFGGNK